MRGGFPYVPWYHGDFLRSTAGWTLLEQAIYWKLLCAQWESGSLPNDMTRLASIAGTDVDTITTAWRVVSKKFRATQAGLFNKRMRSHKRNAIEHRARLSRAGKHGMRSRWRGKDSAKVIELHGRSKPHE
jgi:uncharacterized protein YdaU (DUF1376 family)